MNKDNVHQWNDRTNEFRTKKNIFYEVCENRDFWILSIILSLALIFAIPAPVVFAGSADEITDDREARRHAMLQAWLFEDHTRITHPKDREKYNLPPLGTAEAKRYSPPEPLFSMAPLDIAGEGPDLWKYANKKNLEYQRE